MKLLLIDITLSCKYQDLTLIRKFWMGLESVETKKFYWKYFTRKFYF